MKEPELEEERLIANAKGLKLSLERRSLEEKIAPVKLAWAWRRNLRGHSCADGGWFRRLAGDGRRQNSWALQGRDLRTPGYADCCRKCRHRRPAREMSEVTATEGKMKPLADATGGGVFWTRTQGLLSSATSVDVPRISMMSNAKVMAGSGWLGLRDRQAFLTRGVKLT